MKRLLVLTSVAALTAAAGCSTPSWCPTRKTTTYAPVCAPVCQPVCPQACPQGCGEVGTEAYFPSATSGTMTGTVTPSLVTPGPETYTPAN